MSKTELKAGDKVGKWTLLGESEKKYHWDCICECGNESRVDKYALLYSKSKCCRSCSAKENSKKRIKDISGNKYNRWTVLYIDSLSRINRGSMWVCRCICGKEKSVSRNSLVKGTSNSCGCLAKQNRKINLRGVPGESRFNTLFSSYKNAAIKRNYTFNLSKEEFKALIKQRCFYCDSEPNNLAKISSKSTSEEWKKLSEFKYNGVDRKNNELGYSVKNCVPCCSKCNIAKMDNSSPEFLSWIKSVHSNLTSKGLL